MAESFFRALKRFERTGRVGALIPFFSENVELRSDSALLHTYGIAGVYQFWRHYSFAFQQIETQVSSGLYGSDYAVLEWQSNAVLSTGNPIRMNGITLLVFERNKIIRFIHYSNRFAVFQRTETAYAA